MELLWGVTVMGFPVWLDLTGRRVLVVGGGPVGRRKAAVAVSAGADVVGVDPRTVEPQDGVEWRPEAYRPDLLAGVRLVFACATPEVNAEVLADATAAGVWANTASGPAGDFDLPAVVRRGAFELAISTNGASPAFARRVRQKLEADCDEAVGAFVAVLAEVREEVLRTVSDPDRRRELLDGFADWHWLARLRAEGAEAVRAAMIAEVSRRG